jgi:hypothetical protein
LTTAEGKILSTIRIDASSQEDSTLSEAYGLMLEVCCKGRGQGDAFERYYSYLKENMQLDNGLYGWSFNNGSLSGSNALVDELRIFKALSRADSLWGGFETDIKSFQQQF